MSRRNSEPRAVPAPLALSSQGESSLQALGDTHQNHGETCGFIKSETEIVEAQLRFLPTPYLWYGAGKVVAMMALVWSIFPF